MLEVVSSGSYRIHGEITMHTSNDALAELLQLVDNHNNNLSHLQLDVSELQAADSVLLALILHFARAIESRNGVLRIAGLPDGLRGLARAYGVDVLINKYLVVS